MTDFSHRPEGYRGRGDSHLPQIADGLRRVLRRTERDFAHDTLRLGDRALDELVELLVEFAEDLFNGVGIWAAYERYNSVFFGAALPLTSRDAGSPPAGIHPDRFRHFLWVVYPALIGGVVFSPTHQDLLRIADAASEFLAGAFRNVPRISGLKMFLQTSNVYGWDVKRKLVWLGSQSYLFRLFFARYTQNRARGKISIALTDDFICQECTEWSGLGAIDVLAGVLDISDDERKGLRSWYERHTAPYKILSVNNKTMDALNVINDQPYRIRINMKNPPFKRGQLVFGSLVPWRGEWYWSGEQRFFDSSSKVDFEQLKRSMKRNSSAIVCRYSKEHETKVREVAARQYDLMMKYHEGNDLAWYPDGLSMAADWEKEARWQWELRSPQEIDGVMGKHHLEKGRPEMNIPKHLLEHKNGIGVFINPDEGKEIMTSFNDLVEGLQRKGEALTEDQEDAIRGFICSDNLSPRFVKRVLEQYGSECVKAPFALQGDLPDYWLDYLLRRYKGRYFRKYYPSISLV